MRPPGGVCRNKKNSFTLFERHRKRTSVLHSELSNFESFLQILLRLVFEHHNRRLRIRCLSLLPRRDCDRCESTRDRVARRILSLLSAVQQKLEQGLSVRKHHLRRLDAHNNRVSTTSSTSQTLVARDLQTAIGTPDILIPTSYEDRLPDSQVLFGTARLPICNNQPDWSECPRCFLLPSREILGLFLAALVKIAPLTFLGESSRNGLVAMNYSRTGAATDHFGLDSEIASVGYQSSVTLGLRLEID